MTQIVKLTENNYIFFYVGNWELVSWFWRQNLEEAMIVYILKREIAMTANGSSYFCYAMIIFVQNLTQVLKRNRQVFLRMQRHNRKILNRILK